MESQKDRLRAFIAYLGMSMRAFERTIGTSQSTISATRDILSDRLISAICDHYPELNRMWLLTGDGNMLHSTITATDSNVQIGNGNSAGIPPKKFENESEWFALVREKDRQIDRLLTIIENINK